MVQQIETKITTDLQLISEIKKEESSSINKIIETEFKDQSGYQIIRITHNGDRPG